jgi:16S rRNA (uracil1498-N3)-methyltransferase
MEPTLAKTRLFIDAPLAEGTAAELSADQARYLGAVLRLGAGDPVAVFNARDGEWRARIEHLKKGKGTLVVEARWRAPAAEPGPWLAFAPLKKTPMDFVAEKATELGVARLLPVLSANTAVGRVNVERLSANAREAAEQCGRLSVPVVDAPVDFGTLLASWPPRRRLLVMDETGEGPPIAEVLTGVKAGQDLGVLVGPEGGFAASELDALADLPFVSRVGLGPRILRAETAALAALACLQAWAGDWRSAPPLRTSR